MSHPLARRTRIRRWLPRFLLELGVARKKGDCEELGAAHDWYKCDETTSACYHCNVVRTGELWRSEPEAHDGRDWATRLAAAIAVQAERHTEEVHLQSVEAVSPDTVEVVYSVANQSSLRGVRVDSASLEAAPVLLKDRTTGEVAFYVLNLAMCEPRSIDEFLPADANGVRWLPIDRWIE